MSQSEFYDLIQPGLQTSPGSHTFGREEVIEFATEFDPQAFHLTDEGAAASHFGKLCASGWHTIAVWMRLNVENSPREFLRATGYQGQPKPLGPSPGVRNIKWTLPVYVGDTITYSGVVVAKQPSTKRPGWAIITNRTTGYNQNGDQVLSMEGALNIRMF